MQLTAPKGSWYFHHFCMKPDEQDAVVHIFRRYVAADGQMALSWWDTFAPHVTHVLTEAFQKGAPVVISAGDPTDEDAVLAAVKAEVRRFYRIVLRMRQSDASALPDQSAKDIVRAVTEPKGDSDWERKAKEDGWDGYSDYEPDPDPPVEPFTYEGDEAYFDIPAVNASSLKKIKKSALHYWQEYRNPDRPEYVPSKSMQLGTCLHALVLENKRVWKTVPDISQSTNLGKCVSALVLEGKRIWVVPPDDVGGPRSLAYKEWKKGVPKDAIILKPEAQAEVFQVYGDIPESERRTDLPDDAPQLTHKEIAQVEGMADSILRHPRASELVANVETEVMLNWKYKLDLDGEQIPVICKGLLDALVPGMGDRPLTIMDIKTAADGSPDAFMRSVAVYNYHIQAAFYRDGLFAQTGDRDIEFVFVVVESAPPYAVGVYLLEPLAIDQGRREYVKALKVYHRCLAAEAEQAGDDPDLRSAWPAYEAPGIGLPRWAWDAHTWKLYNE
ncbi:MAG: PD-(D/E)XK nuclease-like domain-containing protein [Gemmatimonadota bacterium]|nr:PD-(D/E)XK nuclease-like domain-containing protein [Gemmatimonadota bacterium]